jgi:RNA recognition motif-containing protein
VSYKLFVGSLPWSVRDQELKAEFEKYGKVISARVVTDRETRKSRGFGFVEMENEAEAQAAIKSLNGASLKGRNIIVNEARSK